jgi:hypothetical protein
MSLMAISSLLKSKGITPDITSIASRLAVNGKPRYRYVKDLLEKIVSQRCKFADDSTM